MPRRTTSFPLLAALGTALAGGAAPALCDVLWNESTIVSGPTAPRGGGSVETKVMLSGACMRTDVKNRVGHVWDESEKLGLTSPSTIASLEAGHLYRVDPQKQAYIDESLDEASSRLKRVRTKRGPALAF